MSRDIEIKARTDGLAMLIPLVEAITDEGLIDIAQDDTFFQCPNGRLKWVVAELLNYCVTEPSAHSWQNRLAAGAQPTGSPNTYIPRKETA